MLNQQFSYRGLFAVMIVGCALVSASSGGESKPDTQQTTRQDTSVRRRATVPAGWFKLGKGGALTDTKVGQVRPVVHFDTTGEETTAPQAVKRLQRVRDAVLYQDLQQTPPPIETQPAQSGVATAMPTDESKPTSSRRRRARLSPGVTPPQTSASAAETPPANAAQKQNAAGQFPASTTPASLPNTPAVQPADEQPMKVSTQNRSSHTAMPATVAPSQTAGPTSSAETLPSVMKTQPAATPPFADASVASDASPNSRSRITPSAAPVKATVGGQADAESTSTRAADTAGSVAEGSTSTTQPTPQTAASVKTAANPATSAPSKDVLIENESPVLSVITRGPSTLVVGKAATYAVNLANRSQVTADRVVVRVNIPQWVDVARQRPTVGTADIRPDDSGQSVLAWEIDRLPANGQEQLLIELIPRGSRPVDLGVTWMFSPARTSTQIQVREPKLHLTVVGPQDVRYGDTKVYTVTVSNPGTGDAEDVVLKLLPLIPNEREAGVRKLGTIPAGSRRTLEVELTTRQTGRLQVRAEVVADGGLRAQAHQEVMVRRAALDVAVEGPPMKYAGSRSRYTVRVANRGDAAASDVNVTATLPAGANGVASSDGGTFDPNTGQVQWHVGILRPGASRVLELECTLTSAGENRLDLRAAGAGDLTALGFATTQVESLADLKLTVNDPHGAVAVGDDVVYEVTIKNRGTKAAGNIQIFGYFSEGIEPVTVKGWRGQVNEGEVVLQTIPRLGPGQDMSVQITAQADRSGDHVFRAELECEDPETKLAVEEWTRFYGDADVTNRPAARTANSANKKPLKLQRY